MLSHTGYLWNAQGGSKGPAALLADQSPLDVLGPQPLPSWALGAVLTLLFSCLQTRNREFSGNLASVFSKLVVGLQRELLFA